VPAVPGYQRKAFLHRGSCHDRIEDVQAVRLRVLLQEFVCSRAGLIPKRHDHVCREKRVDAGKVSLIARADNKLKSGDLRDCPSFRQRIDEIACLMSAARNVYQDIAIDQKRHWQALSPSYRAGVCRCIRCHRRCHRDPSTCRRTQIPYGARFAFEAKRKRRYAHLNYRAFVDRNVFKGFENALLIFCSDSHGFARSAPLNSRVTDRARHFFRPAVQFCGIGAPTRPVFVFGRARTLD
jgi:hypothetical protein